MKIEKLYTLSQFVDWIEKEQPFDIEPEYCPDYWWVLVAKYNDFLKQPITKDMFVNELVKPNQDDLTSHKLPKYLLTENYIYDLKLWQQAEKKVIFKGMSKHNYDNGFVIDCDYLDMFFDLTEYETLRDLAEATNGELELKNVELWN